MSVLTKLHFNTTIASFWAIWAISFLLPSMASAAIVRGNAVITIVNPAVIASNPGDWYFETFWGASDDSLRIDDSTPGGNALAINGGTTWFLPVNSNTSTIVTSNDLYGRTLQATDMDATNTAVGQIGLNGAMRMRDPAGETYLSPYDFSVVKTNNQWLIRTYDNAFSYSDIFRLGNVSETVDDDGLLYLRGDIRWAAGRWSSLLRADTSTVIGYFELRSVPLPGAAWLFASALIGFMGISRKRFIKP